MSIRTFELEKVRPGTIVQLLKVKSYPEASGAIGSRQFAETIKDYRQKKKDLKMMKSNYQTVKS